jgi:hypothetical protein
MIEVMRSRQRLEALELPAIPITAGVVDSKDEAFGCVLFYDLELERPVELGTSPAWLVGLRFYDADDRLLGKDDTLLVVAKHSGTRLKLHGCAVQDSEQPAEASRLGLSDGQAIDLRAELTLWPLELDKHKGSGSGRLNPFGRLRPLPVDSDWQWALTSDDPLSPRSQGFSAAGFYSYSFNNPVYSVPGLSWPAPSGVLHFSSSELISGKVLRACGPAASGAGDCEDFEYDDVTFAYLGTGPMPQTPCSVSCGEELVAVGEDS